MVTARAGCGRFSILRVLPEKDEDPPQEEERSQNHYAQAREEEGPFPQAVVNFGTAAQFSRGVGLSMFAAEKILRLRDQHLAMR